MAIAVVTTLVTHEVASLPEILAQFGLVHIRDNTGTPNGFGDAGEIEFSVAADAVRVGAQGVGTQAVVERLRVDLGRLQRRLGRAHVVRLSGGQRLDLLR